MSRARYFYLLHHHRSALTSSPASLLAEERVSVKRSRPPWPSTAPRSAYPSLTLPRAYPQVIINGRREDVIKATAEEINKEAKEAGMGGEVIPVQGDVATKQGIVEFYDKCTKHLDKVCHVASP